MIITPITRSPFEHTRNSVITIVHLLVAKLLDR